MYISMQVTKMDRSVDNSTFDEVDIRETGQTIGEAIGEALDMELSYPDTKQVKFTIIT